MFTNEVGILQEEMEEGEVRLLEQYLASILNFSQNGSSHGFDVLP